MDVYLGLDNTIEIYLEKGKPDLERLKTEGKLEAYLKDINAARDPGKKVILIYDKDQVRGYFIRYFPERTDLKTCSKIEITVNELVCKQLEANDYSTSLNANCISINHRKQTKFMKRFKKPL